jgi:uncharacterized protein (DUF1501 family)
MDLSRRGFLKGTGLGLLASGLPPSFVVRAARAEHKRGRVLVILFQRGGMDGLNAVIPFKESAYYRMRPTIAVPAPGAGEEKAIDLDGFYALHPSLAPLKPLYDQGHLAIVHATGSPNNTRSHFDAQDYMEIGAPGTKSTPDGWLNRYLAEAKTPAAPLRAVSVSPRLPRILYGNAVSVNLSSIAEFHLHDAGLVHALQRLYGDAADPLLQSSGTRLFAAMTALGKVQSAIPAEGQGYPKGPFGARMGEIARLIKANAGLEIAFTEIEGWDTHVNEGGAGGQLANRLRNLAEGISAFFSDLGDRSEDVMLVTMSEFGRTAGENGNRGTDHGHANVMFVLGGKVRGGRVYGSWPGLQPELLYEGRDLALTTDFRSVCGEVLVQHMGQINLRKIFPGFTSARTVLEWNT